MREAAAAGIPVVAMDRLPVGASVRLYVTADNRRAGRLQAQYLADKLGGKGGVVLLEGEAGNSVARDITAGNLDVLARYPEMRIVLRRAHKNWARDLARITTEDAYVKDADEIKGILANNSGMAMGALEAVESRRPPATAVVIGALAAGRLAADVDKMPTEIARASYEAALSLARGERVSGDATLDNGGVTVDVKLVPVRLITPDNVRPVMEYRWGTL